MEANHTAQNKYVYASPNILFGKWDEVPSKQHHACNTSKDFLDTKVGYWNRNPRKHFYPVYGVVQLCFARRI